jgi:hypothetical protein
MAIMVVNRGQNSLFLLNFSIAIYVRGVMVLGEMTVNKTWRKRLSRREKSTT